MNGEKTKLDFYKAIANPLRRHVLLRCFSVEASATEVAEELGHTRLDDSAYSFRVLAASGFLKLVDSDRRKGGLQKFYRFDPATTVCGDLHAEGDALLAALIAVSRAAHCQRIPESLRKGLVCVGRMLELVTPLPGREAS